MAVKKKVVKKTTKKRCPPVAKKGTAKKTTKKKTGFRTGGSGAVQEDGFYDRMAKGREKVGSGGNFWKAPVGDTTLRLIPFTHDGKQELYSEETSHVKVHDDAPSNLPCLGVGCPICNIVEEYELPDKKARDLSASKKWNMNIVVRATKNSTSGDLAIWGASKSCIKDVLDLVVDRVEYPDILDLKKGRDFILTRTGEGKSTRYKVRAGGSPRPAPAFEGEPIDLIERLEKKEKRAEGTDYQEIAESIIEVLEAGE